MTSKNAVNDRENAAFLRLFIGAANLVFLGTDSAGYVAPPLAALGDNIFVFSA
jgi:hypothetical protein